MRKDKQHKGSIWEDYHLANGSSRKIMENKGEEIIKEMLEVHFLKLKKEMFIILRESNEYGVKEYKKGNDRHIIKCQETADKGGS